MKSWIINLSKNLFKRKWLIYLISAVVAIFILQFLITLGYQSTWTGFGNSYHTTTKNQAIQPAKTLWDWMQLLVIPLALVIGGFFLNRAEKRREEQLTRERNEEVALNNYLDAMSELIANKGLSNDNVGQTIRNIASTRTISILHRISKTRINIVFNFLRKARLIRTIYDGKINEKIDFKNAELSGINLSNVYLELINLEEANLEGAILEKTILHNAKCRNIKLSNANLIGADLGGTDFYLAQIVNANLNKALLWSTKLCRTNLSSSNLKEAEMNGAILMQTFLKNAKLNGAKINAATLIEVNLEKANLKGVELSHTILDKTDFKQVKNLTQKQLDKAGFVYEPPINFDNITPY